MIQEYDGMDAIRDSWRYLSALGYTDVACLSHAADAPHFVK